VGTPMADADRLAEYRDKREFGATPEPQAERESGDSPPIRVDLPRFVVQEHHATSLHWDLRLEHEGALASWAVPRGIPPDPKRNHLAVRTEDHPLSYLDFEAVIPPGQYGAGEMTIWDRGVFELEKWRKDEVMVVLRGERVQGRYVLFRTDGKNWMIHRMDPPQDPDRRPMPTELVPMLAKSGPLPTGDGWGYEVKWDGVRALAFVSGGRVKLVGRSGREVTSQYPEVRGLGEALGTREAIFDGEVVAFGENGLPSFERLQRRMHVASSRAVARLARESPVAYVLFDLLWLEGRSLMELTYTERREELTALDLHGRTWQVPRHHVGDGEALLELTRRQGLEGVMAKRLDCPYTPGKRGGGWVKVKNVHRTSLVVGGWLDGERGRAGSLGALTVGFYEDGELQYAGRVGTGFGETERARLLKLLAPLAAPASPFSGRQPPKETHWVSPELVCEVEYRQWTRTRTLRAPAYKGLRDDLNPEQAVFESQ
jgi:bifunctional non-homologous end joining protein LigD